MPSKVETPRQADRRATDRRAVQVPIDFPDRRQAQRRSGAERRQHPG